MRGMRNLLVHHYANVSLLIVWQTVQIRLPQLVPLLDHILKQEN